MLNLPSINVDIENRISKAMKCIVCQIVMLEVGKK